MILLTGTQPSDSESDELCDLFRPGNQSFRGVHLVEAAPSGDLYQDCGLNPEAVMFSPPRCVRKCKRQMESSGMLSVALTLPIVRNKERREDFEMALCHTGDRHMQVLFSVMPDPSEALVYLERAPPIRLTCYVIGSTASFPTENLSRRKNSLKMPESRKTWIFRNR